jgi:putative hydrolase of the HAD superfamily
MASVTHLFLDIGGVLLTNGWDRAMRQEAARTFGLDYEEMNERHHLTFATYEEGKATLDEYLDRTVFYEERPFTREEFRAFMFARSQPLPGMLDYVAGLKRRHNLKCAAVSNEGRDLTVFKVRTFELYKVVDFFVCSCFVHFRKPDEDIWRIALDIALADPDRVVYIDDRPLFVEVAEGLGLKGIVHTGLAPTKAALGRLGLE